MIWGDSLTDHLIFLVGAFLWIFLARPNLLEDGMSHELCIFCSIGIEGGGGLKWNYLLVL